MFRALCTEFRRLTGPYVVQISSRNTPSFGPSETFVAHRVVGRVDVQALLSDMQSGGRLKMGLLCLRYCLWYAVAAPDPLYCVGALRPTVCNTVGITTPERLVFDCRTTSASTAPRTPRTTCCPYADVLSTVFRVSRSCGLFPDGFDLHLLP